MDDISAPSIAKGREIVAFHISEQSFCIDIEHVREIRGWSPTTTLPHAPDYVKGMMNLRGIVLPVVDLSLRLGLGSTQPSSRHVIIIVMLGSRLVGLLVEAVSDILNLPYDSMKSTPDVASTATKSFIEGIFTIDDRMIRAIDVGCLLPSHQGIENA